MSRKEDELTTAKEICQKFSTPFDTTAKVMQTLNQKGYIASKQGAHGGYTLRKSLKEISFLELAKSIENQMPSIDCLQEGKKCEQRDTCNIITPMQQLNEQLTLFMNNLTLEQLFNSNISLNRQGL